MKAIMVSQQVDPPHMVTHGGHMFAVGMADITTTFQAFGNEENIEVTVCGYKCFDLDSEYDIEVKITEKPKAIPIEHTFK